MRAQRTLLALTVVAGFAVACVTTGVSNLTSTRLAIAPTISHYSDPDTQFDTYQTFSVFPYSLLSPEDSGNEIQEKQILFSLRNDFEEKGYRFVEITAHPDFLATVRASSKHVQIEVPSYNLALPTYVPGNVITITGLTTATGGTGSGWGTYTAISSSTTYVPGYVTTQQVTVPGQTVGYESPSVAVSVFDSKTLKRLWLSLAVGDRPAARRGAGFVHAEFARVIPPLVLGGVAFLMYWSQGRPTGEG